MRTTVGLPAARRFECAPSPPDGNCQNVPPVRVPQVPLAIAIFLSAFLLFFVQLLLGKLVLPMFGGAPAVWTACLLVFQLLLLAGYALAHMLASYVPSRLQSLGLLLLLGASILLMAGMASVWPTPITPGVKWFATATLHPSWSIIHFLLATIGVPFLILSTTSPLLQVWFSRTRPGDSPYRLYALSNTGSLLGLLSYPFVVEPLLHLHTQAWIWICVYLIYASFYGMCAWKVRGLPQDDRSANLTSPVLSGPAAALGWKLPALWISLAACASVQLMATTNHICQEVAVIPFLWVLPLALYLLSFVLSFESNRWYERRVFHPVFAVAAGWMVLEMLPGTYHPYLNQLAACSLLLFAGCIICHGEAALLRPSARRLTIFYLCISSGGALGGVFGSLIAPHIFPGYWEFPLGILMCAALLYLTQRIDPGSWLHRSARWLVVVVGAGVIWLALIESRKVWEPAGRIPNWTLWSIAGAMGFLAASLYYRDRRKHETLWSNFLIHATLTLAFVVLIVGLLIPQRWLYIRAIARSRNFYGVSTVIDVQPANYLMLTHGLTAHGFQYEQPDKRRVLTGYYGQYSGANVLLKHWPRSPIRVGLVGMGAGTLAGLGKPGDTYRFYEINPEVVRFSAGEHAYFTFIRDSAAHIEVVVGDARMSLEQETGRGEKQHFDVLVLDAFSSDAIPLHLLTKEAFETYLQHLSGPDSVIAVHISNNTLDLGPVLAGIAYEFQFHALRTNPTWLTGLSAKSDWVLLSRSAKSISASELQQLSVPFPGHAKPLLWTDDYSNLLGVLR
jgi:hypothetical protein